MGEDVLKLLNSMEGQTVNLYVCGLITSYRVLENFQWWIEQMYSGKEFLVLGIKDSETRISILMDEIYNIKADEGLGEIIFTLDTMGMAQIWLDCKAS